MTRLQMIKHILRTDDELRDWYIGTIGVCLTDWTEQSVYEYGLTGHGDVAGHILQDGQAKGIITAEQYEDA